MKDALRKATLDRNAALVEVMLLAASADGKVSGQELRTLLARVLERPEFDGTDADTLNGLVESSAARLAQAARLDDVLDSLRARLPDHRTRLLAFGLGTAVALADRGHASREELGYLKTLQAALGIDESEVQQVYEAMQQGQPLAEVLGEPLERLYAETMALVSTADGQVHERELTAMLESMAGDPAFRDVSLELAERYLKEAFQSLAVDGLPSRLTVLAQGLTTKAQRVKAYTFATRVAHADGQQPSPGELKVLELLQATFGLADDEVARIL